MSKHIQKIDGKLEILRHTLIGPCFTYFDVLNVFPEYCTWVNRALCIDKVHWRWFTLWTAGKMIRLFLKDWNRVHSFQYIYYCGSIPEVPNHLYRGVIECGSVVSLKLLKGFFNCIKSTPSPIFCQFVCYGRPVM